MSEEDELARRFVALWAEYLTALAGDQQALGVLRRWLALCRGLPGERAPRSPGDAAAAAGASDGGDAAVVELARRVDDLAERLARLEAGRKRPHRTADGPRRRDRTTRN
jgi:hypothetical protein